MEPELWLPFLQDIADRGDDIALRFFRAHDLRVERKSDSSPVTMADREIEASARELAEKRGIGICGEEHGVLGSESVRLIIDPIDGTKNFVRGIPIFATLLAIEENGEVVAGLVSAPALKVRWRAARGSGAFCDERRLNVSKIASLREALLFHGSLSGEAESLPPGLIPLLSKVERTRGFGDFWQHLLVAEGCGEIAIDPPTLKPWDIAALQIIVEEAGGQATALGGERSIHAGSLLSSNGVLHKAAIVALST